MARENKGPHSPKPFGRKGQTLVEYAMVLIFVAVTCVAAVTLLGIPISGFYTGINGSF